MQSVDTDPELARLLTLGQFATSPEDKRRVEIEIKSVRQRLRTQRIRQVRQQVAADQRSAVFEDDPTSHAAQSSVSTSTVSDSVADPAVRTTTNGTVSLRLDSTAPVAGPSGPPHPATVSVHSNDGDAEQESSTQSIEEQPGRVVARQCEQAICRLIADFMATRTDSVSTTTSAVSTTTVLDLASVLFAPDKRSSGCSTSTEVLISMLVPRSRLQGTFCSQYCRIVSVLTYLCTFRRSSRWLPDFLLGPRMQHRLEYV